MSRLEDLVTAYLDRVESEPELTPERFSAEHPECSAELVQAIRSTLEASALFEPIESSAERPRRLGSYELGQRIGRGGMGVVYEARRAESDDGERLALKLLPTGSLANPRLLERFRRESRILARLQHDQIVALRDEGVHDDTPYLVMDFVEGESLDTHAGHQTWREAAELVASLARAVDAAHAAGVLHRDLKPQNVIVRPSGEPVLLDFGLVSADEEATLTSTGDLLGTPRYMSPEQAAGREASVRSDVYALGALLVELLTGRPAFPQDSRDAVLRAVRRAAWSPPRKQRPDLPRQLDRICRVAMAWNPSHRYASALELAEDLERLLRGEPPRRHPPGAAIRMFESVRRRPLVGVVGALVIALLATFVVGIVAPAIEEHAERAEVASARSVDRAIAHWIRGREAKAAELLNALSLETGDGPILSDLMRGAEPREAETPRDRAILGGWKHEREGDRDRAAESYVHATAIDPRSTLAAVLAARCFLELGEETRAESVLHEASRHAPSSLAVAQELARTYQTMQRYEGAEREYRRALAIDEHDPNLWQGLAVVLFRAERNAEALDAARRSSELAGELDPSLANTMAALLDRLGNHAEAQATFQRLVEQQPENPVYVFNLAFSLDSELRVREAAPLYERVLELDPENSTAAVCLAWLWATAEDDELHREQDAEELILTTLRLDRGRSPALVQGAVDVAKKTGRTERIAELFDELAQEGDVDARAIRLERARRTLLEATAKER